MKTTTTFAAVMIVASVAAAAFAQGRNDAMMVRLEDQPETRLTLRPTVSRSDYLGLAVQSSYSGRGLKVHSTEFGSAAATFGLEQGDIIVGAGGDFVDTMADLENAFRVSGGNVEVTVKDINTGRWLTGTMKRGSGSGRINNAVAYVPGLGVEVEILNAGGYKITRVEGGSVADQINLTAGDVILKVNGVKIENVRNPSTTFARSFTMIYNDRETGLRYSLERNVWRD